MRSFGTFLGIIVMVGMGLTVCSGSSRAARPWIEVMWILIKGVFIATMDTHWQISVPDPGHRQVFLDFIERKYRKYLRVASLNYTKGYGNIVKVIQDSLHNVVDTVTPIWNWFWFYRFLISILNRVWVFNGDWKVVKMKTTKDTLLSTWNNDDILFYRNHWFIYNSLFRYWSERKTLIKSYI